MDSAAPAWRAGRGWTVDSIPELDLGVLEGTPELTFDGIRSVRPLWDGGMLVAQETEVRMFDGRGAHVRTLGRPGDGPGEFRLIARAEACGDQIYASDFLTGMLTSFRRDGTLDSAVPLARSDYATSRSLVGCAGEGPVLEVPFPRMTAADQPRIVRPEFALVRTRTGVAVEDTITTLAGGENYTGLAVPFGRTTTYAIGDSTLHVADTGMPEIRLFDLDGRLRRLIRFAPEPKSVIRDDVERIRAQYLDVPASIAEREIRPRLDALTMPSTMPFFQRMLVAPDGTIWLAPYYPFRDGEDRRWQVIGRDGVWLGAITLPAGLEVHAITDSHIVGIWRDENDVEHVRKHRLRRG